jgi:DNA-directed RNA polymerase
MEPFEQLASQYQPMIHKIIRSLHIYKNIDEFYQIGLIALWEAQKKFHAEKGSFPPFAYSLIRGKILHQLIKDRKQEEKIMLPEETYWEVVAAQPRELISEQEFLQTYGKNLTKIETKWLIDACFSGYSLQEIAASEHISVSAVKQWAVSARKKLRKQRQMMS